jgi:hypothetical protein
MGRALVRRTRIDKRGLLPGRGQADCLRDLLICSGRESSGVMQALPKTWLSRSRISKARFLGETHGWTKRHTAFDLWHLAAAWSLGVGVFLTFDERQKEICKLLSFRTD